MQVEELNHLTNKIAISSTNNEPSLDQCILSIIEKEGYVTFDITKKQFIQDCANLLGILYEVNVKGKTKEGQKTTAIFVKTMPPNKVDLGFNLQDFYDKEKFIYEELSKIYDKMQNEAAIPEEKRYRMVKSYDETHPKALFLENIAIKGFRTWFRMDVIALDYAEVCIQQLARFHGLSFALELKETDYFNSFIKPMKYGPRPGEAHEGLCDCMMKTVVEMLDSCDKHLEGELRKVYRKFHDYIAENDTICCLCHGDYKPNNIMYKTAKGRVTEVIPIDYQLSYYGCPVLDVIYFIYSSTDHQFRKDHLQHLKDLYHETLTEYLNYFNISVDSLFSKNQFEELYEKKKNFGLSITLLIVPLMFADKDNVLALDDVTDPSKHVIDKRYKKRLYDAIKEFYDV